MFVNVEGGNNRTNILGVGLEEIISASIVNHTGELAIVSSMIFTIFFIQLGMKFPSDGEDFHIEMYIFVKPGVFLVMRKRRKSGKQME